MNVRGPSLASDYGNHGHEWSTGVASVGYEVCSKHSATSTESRERDNLRQGFSLRIHSTRDRTVRRAIAHSQVGHAIS